MNSIFIQRGLQSLPIEGADAKASVALTEPLGSQKRLACELSEGVFGLGWVFLVYLVKVRHQDVLIQLLIVLAHPRPQ